MAWYPIEIVSNLFLKVSFLYRSIHRVYFVIRYLFHHALFKVILFQLISILIVLQAHRFFPLWLLFHLYNFLLFLNFFLLYLEHFSIQYFFSHALFKVILFRLITIVILVKTTRFFPHWLSIHVYNFLLFLNFFLLYFEHFSIQYFFSHALFIVILFQLISILILVQAIIFFHLTMKFLF